MHRRDFLTASAAAVAGAVVVGTRTSSAQEQRPTAGARHWIEVRNYHFASPDKQAAYEKFLTATAVPAFNRAGSTPVGVFRLLAEDNAKLDPKEDPNDLWVILSHASPDAFATFESRLAADAQYQDAGKGLLDTPKSAPAFTRYESMLLLAFEGFPTLRAPPELKDGRVYQMRTYQSHNAERHANKVAMFNAGEIPIFGKVGMPPAFFGAGLAGPDLPHLTYMVHHNSMDASKQDWAAFGKDEDWVKMRNLPQYKDNVSKIIARFLRPSPGSQL